MFNKLFRRQGKHFSEKISEITDTQGKRRNNQTGIF